MAVAFGFLCVVVPAEVLKVVVGGGPAVVTGFMWSTCNPQRLPHSTHCFPLKMGGGPSVMAVSSSAGR
jgi:hypothetical protein